MAALLIFGVVLLAFLCGRLQVTVTHLRQEVRGLSGDLDALTGRVAGLEHDLDVLDSRLP